MRAFFEWGHGGLPVIVVALLLVFFLRKERLPPQHWTVAVAAVCVAIPLLAELGLSIWYLFSPSFADHIEASVASMTHYFMAGVPIYPDLSAGYTFHGLLYGPLLPELNALGYTVAGGVLAAKLVGWAAAWAAMILMALLTPRERRDWTWAVSFIIFCCLLLTFTSNNMLIADRADSLLLLFATVALACAVRVPGIAGFLVPALLAGLVAGLKLHGPIYILPALVWWAGSHRPNVKVLAAAAVVGLIGLGLPFLPANVSLVAFLSYVKLGAKHGLNLPLFVWNTTFAVAFWVPLVLTRRLSSQPLFAGCLAVSELLVLIVASKPGAGPHHLLPFVSYHCFLLQQLLPDEMKGGTPRLTPSRPAFIGLTAVIVGMAWIVATGLNSLLNFDLREGAQLAAADELNRFADDYPHGMVGIAGSESYGLTSLRPWITLRGTLQTDYGAWMDWNFSGISDEPLAEALAECRIPYLFVPNGGEPFSMNNNYGTGPLFSQELRAIFRRNYLLVQPGQYFNVYGCSDSRTVRRAK
jgi:hypothetical protein